MIFGTVSTLSTVSKDLGTPFWFRQRGGGEFSVFPGTPFGIAKSPVQDNGDAVQYSGGNGVSVFSRYAL